MADLEKQDFIEGIVCLECFDHIDIITCQSRVEMA